MNGDLAQNNCDCRSNLRWIIMWMRRECLRNLRLSPNKIYFTFKSRSASFGSGDYRVSFRRMSKNPEFTPLIDSSTFKMLSTLLSVTSPEEIYEEDYCYGCNVGKVESFRPKLKISILDGHAIVIQSHAC